MKKKPLTKKQFLELLVHMMDKAIGVIPQQRKSKRAVRRGR